MTHYFISYSRQELTFVDSLSQTLQEQGHDVWVDYLRLEPGREWQAQLDEAVDNAAAILLVISKESVSSDAVEAEWKRALANDKRIILIIFEPQQLPEELLACEWVNFQQSFQMAMRELEQLLVTERTAMKSQPPQIGNHPPPTVQWFQRLSIVGAILSLPFIFPAVRLFPFQQQIYQRDYNLNIIRFHLIFVAGIFFAACLGFWGSDAFLFSGIAGLAGLVPATMLLMLTYAPAMYRWGPPEGVSIRSISRAVPYFRLVLVTLLLSGVLAYILSVIFSSIIGLLVGASVQLPPLILFLVSLLIVLMFLFAQPYISIFILYPFVLPFIVRLWIQRITQVEPIHIYISYFRQDSNIVNSIATALRRCGHQVSLTPPVTNPPPPPTDVDCILAVISRYSARFPIQTEPHQVVYTLLVDDADPRWVDDNLTKIQWIDLRRNAPMKISILAHTIHDYSLLQKYLSTPPARNIKRPWVVELGILFFSLIVALRILALIAAAGTIIPIFGILLGFINVGAAIIASIVSGIVIYFARDGLEKMRERQTRFGRFLMSAFLLSTIGLFGIPIIGLGFMLIIWIFFILILWNWQDLRYWAIH